jgi:putative hydrolase of the HAD superfamily
MREVPVTTVFFDVGNTLLTPAVPESEVLVAAVASLGASVNAELVRQNIPRMYQYYEQLYEADNSIWADEDRATGIWLTMYEYLCGLVGIPQLAPEVARLGYERFLDPRSWKPFDDVLPTLEALSARGMRMGLISNWDSSLESIINGVGLGAYFDVIISSAVVGLHKPQPEIFRLALSRAGVSPGDALHVGDHLQADVGGAAAVGITPVLVDRDDRQEDVEGGSFARVRDLREIVECL